MATAAVFTKTGSKAPKAVALPQAVFGVEVKNTKLLAQAYRAYLANRRQNSAQTLTRGQVRGGGRKPWQQKGLGRARAGSRRSPIWTGGGITFGPTGAENYSVQLPLKAKRLAIRQALSGKAKDSAIKVIEELELKDGKTKAAVALLKKLGASRRTLLVVADKTAAIERATRNLADVETVAARYLNVFTVLNAETIIITQPALKAIGEWLSPKVPAPAAKTTTEPAND